MASLQDLNEHFRTALLETVPCAVVIVEADGRIIHWNRSADELTGYQAEEALGATCEMMQMQLASEQDPEVLKALCPPGRGGGAEQECRIRTKHGQIVPVVRISRPVKDDGGRAVGTILALVNVSAVKRARYPEPNLAAVGFVRCDHSADSRL